MDEAAAPNHYDEREVLGRVSRELVQALKVSYGKGPTRAKSYLCDNILLVVLSGGLLPAEQTMLDQGRDDLVRSFRQEYENEMAPRFSALVEEITARKVINYQSQIMFDPDMMFEVFVLDGSAQTTSADTEPQSDAS